jgi:FAD/FMN-containing dehydrogenase
MNDPSAIEALATELRQLLGDDAVSTDEASLDKASIDGARLSPLISEQLPLGHADLVARPADAEQIAATVAAAVRHHVPITPRGKGTGNYGQAIPMSGGLVLDMSGARTIGEVADGTITADAGATFVELERAAYDTGQQILLYPSTARSTIGGFLSGGSGGTGSIKHGMMHTGGFVRALDVVHAVPDARLVHVEGAEAGLYLHNYGTAGIIARATVALEPRQDWQGLFASFEHFEQALSVIRPFAEIRPTPRLVSADPPILAEALPTDAGIPAGRSSLRAILDPASLDAARQLVEDAGGRVEDVRDGFGTIIRISMMSYNHPIDWLQKAYPGTYFHLEVRGDALVERFAELVEVYPGGLLHIESNQGRPTGMLTAPYRSAEEVYAGFERLTAIDVGYHNCHQWFVDFEPDRTRALAATTDPDGLLNPGKLQRQDLSITGSQT